VTISTADLRSAALAELRRLGATVERVKDDQFNLVAQVYRISYEGFRPYTVALRTSLNGWFGAACTSDVEPMTYNTLSNVDIVILVYATAPDRAQFTVESAANAIAGFERQREYGKTKGKTYGCGDQVWAPMDVLTAFGDPQENLALAFAVTGVSTHMHNFSTNPPAAPRLVTAKPDVDPIQAALGLPDWMWQAVQERATLAGVEPKVIIRVLLGDHFAAATQSPLPVRLGA
jgi:hypothetical protein